MREHKNKKSITNALLFFNHHYWSLLKNILIRLPRAHVKIAPCATILFLSVFSHRGATFFQPERQRIQKKQKQKQKKKKKTEIHTRTNKTIHETMCKDDSISFTFRRLRCTRVFSHFFPDNIYILLRIRCMISVGWKVPSVISVVCCVLSTQKIC